MKRGATTPQLAEHCRTGNIVSIEGASVIPSQNPFSTSRPPYHLRVKGIVNLVLLIKKLDTLPWGVPQSVHPLVPLRCLDRVTTKQLICVAVRVEGNPGVAEHPAGSGPALVCNGIVQQESTKVRCSFGREHAQALAAIPLGDIVLRAGGEGEAGQLGTGVLAWDAGATMS